MHFSAHLLLSEMPFRRMAFQVAFILGIMLAASSALAQNEIENPKTIISAKTIYFEDKSGVDAVGKKASAELIKWGRFQIVADRRNADLILELETDPHQGGNLIMSGGQTGTIDSDGHVQEDHILNRNKLSPVKYAFLTVMDAHTGKTLWSASQRWGGLLTGFDSVGEHLVKEFEIQEQVAERRSKLKVIKSVNPTYPVEASTKNVEGTVIVRIEVGKDGKVASAKALSGPPALYRSSVDAAMQFQYEPLQDTPVTTTLEMSYGLGPIACPPGKKGHHPEVTYTEKLPMKTEHAGELKIVGDINEPLPPYPEEAREAGVEGDLEIVITVASSGEVIGALVTKSVAPAIDEAALSTVRTWKFKVTRGEQAAFPIKFLYRLTCFFSDEK